MNNFAFNYTHYLQKLGGAMGMICAPSNGNTFMIDFERKHIYPYIDEGFYYVMENHKVWVNGIHRRTN